MGQWLGEISYILGIIGNFILFIILFTPRIERKKSNTILAVGFFSMLVVHQVLVNCFKISLANAAIFSMSIPSLFLCYFISKYRDGRFFFTFCLADIMYVIVRIISSCVSLLFKSAMTQSVAEFVVKIVLLSAMIYVIWKHHSVYERILRTMEHGWGLLACESICFYFFFYLLISNPAKVYNRLVYDIILLFYCAIVVISYLVIFKLITQMSKTHAEKAKNQLLETQLKLQKSELKVKQLYQEMAYKDQLTGIANRTAFEEKVDTYVKEHRDIVLFMFDINGLKYTNDTYGHTEGDFLIKNVAAVIDEVFASCGTAYRIGGDELVALVEQQPQFDAEATVRKVNAELEGLTKTVFADKPYYASVSTGFSIVPKVDAEKMKDALIFADRMMYAEKKANGKQRV